MNAGNILTTSFFGFLWPTYGHTGESKYPQLIDYESTPAWIRTKDQLIKSQLLYQLSYRGVALCRRHLDDPKGSIALTTSEN